MTPQKNALPEWADFERVDQDDGEITYESHGREGKMDGSDTFIVIYGAKAKVVAETIRAALQAAQVEKVEGLAEYKIRIEAAKQRLGDAKAIHSEWMMMPNYEAEKYAQNKMPEIEHIIYSAICYLDGIEGRNREAARLQLARQEGK